MFSHSIVSLIHKMFTLFSFYFPNIIISTDTRRSFYDSLGFIHLGLFKFLLDESCLQTNALKDNDMEIC